MKTPLQTKHFAMISRPIMFSATGILPRNTELIHGIVVKKMTISPKHSKVVTKLGHILAQAISENRIVRQEKPITIGDSEPRAGYFRC